MSDSAPAPDWWMASDGKWYPPELRPDSIQTSAPPPAGSQVAPAGTRVSGDEIATNIVIGVRASKRTRLSKPLLAGIAALVAILLAIVILIVTSGGAVVATAFLGGSGTATINIRLGTVPTFDGTMGSAGLNGSVAGSNSADSGQFGAPLSGTLGGTSFHLSPSVSPSQNPLGSPQQNIVFQVSGNYGSLPVRGTLTWDLPTNIGANEIQMTVHGTVGTHTLNASGTVSGSGQTLVGQFHYTVT